MALLSLTQLYASIDEIWSLIKNARVREARTISCKLVQDIESGISHEDRAFLSALADACFVCGYAISMSSRNGQAIAAIKYYEQMEEAARAINDPTRLTISLTYQGDAYRRCDNIEKALVHLQTAYNIFPHADKAAHGNCAQLLGRVYFYLDDIPNFERLLAEAEDIACGISPTENCTHGQYCLGTVYIEYARTYGKRGHMQKAMKYLNQAEKTLPLTPHWQTLLMATRTDLLIRQGDISQGVQLAIKLVEHSYEHGNMRLLERIYDLQSFLEKRAIELSGAAVSLNEALHGPFEE